MLAAMLALGIWQLNRAAEKTSMLSDMAASSTESPVLLDDITSLEVAADRYQRVQINATWQDDHQFLWDNRVHKQTAGYEVISPVLLPDGRYALVNRGWVPLGLSRAELPEVGLPSTIEREPMRLTSALSRPSRGLASGEALGPVRVQADAGRSGGESGGRERIVQVLQYFDYEQMAVALGLTPADLIAAVLQPDAATRGASTESHQGLWFIANWQPTDRMGPAKHYSYAFQWFAMALALTILYVVYHLRRRPAASANHQPVSQLDSDTGFPSDGKLKDDKLKSDNKVQST